MEKRQRSGNLTHSSSIPEEEGLKKSTSQPLDDSIISEESFLKEQSTSQPKPQRLGPPTVVQKKPVYTIQKPVQNFSKGKVEPVKPKIDRIRDSMADDYDNDGFDSYGGSLKAS